MTPENTAPAARRAAAALAFALCAALPAGAQTLNADIKVTSLAGLAMPEAPVSVDQSGRKMSVTNLDAPPRYGSDGYLYAISNQRSGSNPQRALRMKPVAGGSYEAAAVAAVDPATGFNEQWSLASMLLRRPAGGFYGLARTVTRRVAGPGFENGAVFTFEWGRTLDALPSLAGKLSSPGGIALAPDGTLFGTLSDLANGLPGRIYRIDPAGVHAVLYNFPLAAGETAAQAAGGAWPLALTVAGNGQVYGVAGSGGAPRADKPGETPAGVLYRMDPASPAALSVLHTFVPSEGSLDDTAALAEGRDGWLYGSARAGGAAAAGMVYRIRLDGSGFAVLHTFGGADGKFPSGPLALAADGNIYGTTRNGGASDAGTLFRIVTARAGEAGGGFEPLYQFRGMPDGKVPVGLTAGDDGRLYGATRNGGPEYQRAVQFPPNSPPETVQSDGGTLFQVELDALKPGATLSLSLSAEMVTVGTQALLSWTATDAANCEASGTWSGAQPVTGTLALTPPKAGSYGYTLSCDDLLKGGKVAASTTLRVNPAAAVVLEPQSAGNGGAAGPLALAALALGWAWRRARRR
ncbi:choice-of-anchor tandem repeat GloVer-containing protein [Cupriavidus ulmosensis]